MQNLPYYAFGEFDRPGSMQPHAYSNRTVSNMKLILHTSILVENKQQQIIH